MAQLTQELSAAGVTYQTTPDGAAIEVPAEQLDKARVAVAAKGVPQSGRFGFELFDKPNWVGSEFDEKVNFQRALEGELEHTIETLDAVRSARVHVVLPRQGAFLSEDVPAKASVVLKLRRSDLPKEQSASIRSLIAGAVEGLHVDAVTLVDADGRSDLNVPSGTSGGHEEEAALQQKLTGMLEPLAGSGNVRATVAISYSESTEEHTDDIYDPAQTVAVATQRSEQSSQSSRNGGIPGAQSNTPAATPAPPPPLMQTAGSSTAAPGVTGNSLNGGPSQTMREESSSYAVTHHVIHTQEGPGRIRRISTAIVVNDRQLTEAVGKQQHMVWRPRTGEEMRRLQQLAEAAVGFDSSRGDQVVLQNISFSGNAETSQPPLFERIAATSEQVLRRQPSLLRTLAMALTVLVLGFAVVKPLAHQATALLNAPLRQIASVSTALDDAAFAEGSKSLSSTTMDVARSTPAQHVFDRVRDQIRSEPNGSTKLVESWLAAPIEDNEL